MASVIDISALSLNAKEDESFGTFVNERVFDSPEISTFHKVWSGVTMKQQIIFASQFSDSGIADASCTRPESGAGAEFTEKFAEPEKVGDTLIHCQKDVNSLFKAYYNAISTYDDLYNIDGTEEQRFIVERLSIAAKNAAKRLIWLGDKTAASATAGAAGLKVAGQAKFYTPIDGIWKKVFAGVTAIDVDRYTITENAETTTVAQLTLADGRSVEIFEGVWANADPRLKADPNKMMMVNNAIWENYRQYLQSKGENFTIQYTTEGFRELMWNGVKVINMELLWDLKLQADFVDNTTNNAYNLPNRVMLTVPDNIPVFTLNEDNMDEVRSWYNEDDRVNKMAYGFTLDTNYLEGYMISVAY